MPPLPTYHLKHCILRPPSLRDFEAIAHTANDKTIARNTVRLPYPYTKQHAREWVLRCQRRHRQKTPTDLTWLVEIDGQAVGAVGLHHIIPRHKAEVGYWLGKEYRGRGIVPAAARVVVQYARAKLQLKILYAYTFSYNPASGRVLEKSGFTKRGVLPKFVIKNGRYIDDIIYVREL